MAPVLSTISSRVAIGAGTIAITIIGALIIKKLRQEKIPQEWQEIGTVKKLYIYPFKSGTGIEHDTLIVTEKAVIEPDKNDKTLSLKDRSFVMYKPDVNEIRTARQLPKAFLIQIRAAEKGVILSAPGQNDIYINIPKVKNNVSFYFGKEKFTCTDCGDAVAKWLSKCLLDEDRGLRLGYGDGSVNRDIRGGHQKWADYYDYDNRMQGIFSDLAALHTVNQATVDDLNKQLSEDQQITFMNFRPNVLIEGPEKFAEDTWTYVKFGDEVVAKVGLECLRCIETTISPDGVMSKVRQPMKMLEQYRRTEGPFPSGVMGTYLRVLKTGKIHRGDPIYIPKNM